MTLSHCSMDNHKGVTQNRIPLALSLCNPVSSLCNSILQQLHTSKYYSFPYYDSRHYSFSTSKGCHRNIYIYIYTYIYIYMYLSLSRSKILWNCICTFPRPKPNHTTGDGKGRPTQENKQRLLHCILILSPKP